MVAMHREPQDCIKEKCYFWVDGKCNPEVKKRVDGKCNPEVKKHDFEFK
jgi:hypothetical protein